MENHSSDKSVVTLYAVFRNGIRVSDTEYESESFAEKELNYWKQIVSRHPDGSICEIKPVQ